MSTINKKPFIAELVHGLQPEAITELYKCLNGQKEIQDLKLGSPRFENFKATNHGVNHVLLEVDNLRKTPGYLIWNGTTFVFISYDNSKKLGQAEINPVTFAINVIKEGLTIEELRRVLYDTIDVKEGGGMSIEEINEAIADGSIKAPAMYAVEMSGNNITNGLPENIKVGDVIIINNKIFTNIPQGTFTCIVDKIDTEEHTAHLNCNAYSLLKNNYVIAAMTLKRNTSESSYYWGCTSYEEQNVPKVLYVHTFDKGGINYRIISTSATKITSIGSGPYYLEGMASSQFVSGEARGEPTGSGKYVCAFWSSTSDYQGKMCFHLGGYDKTDHTFNSINPTSGEVSDVVTQL